MKKRLVILLIFLLLPLTACVEGNVIDAGESEISVYRLIRPEYLTGDELLRAEKIPYSDLSTAVRGAALALKSIPDDPSLESGLPPGVSILGAEQAGRIVDVSMSDSYDKLSGIEKTVADGCITLTMCSIPNVDYVSIAAGNATPRVLLSPEDFMLRNTLTSAEAAEIRLYFPKAGSGVLSAEYRSVTIGIGEDVSAERAVIYELLKGPSSDKLSPALPMDTVVLSVYTLDGVCNVSFSEDFLDSLGGETESIRLAVYSVVNSLTWLKDVDSVKIIVQNNSTGLVGNIDISEPLTRKISLIGSAVTE